MIQAFYRTKPERDTPYRKLSLDYDEEKGWRVLLKSGTKWGPDDSTIESETSVQDFDEGKIVFDRLFWDMAQAGWRPYSPYEDYESGNEGGFQREVRIDLKKPGRRSAL